VLFTAEINARKEGSSRKKAIKFIPNTSVLPLVDHPFGTSKTNPLAFALPELSN